MFRSPFFVFRFSLMRLTILASKAQRAKKLTTAKNQTVNSFTYIPINNRVQKYKKVSFFGRF